MSSRQRSYLLIGVWKKWYPKGLKIYPFPILLDSINLGLEKGICFSITTLLKVKWYPKGLEKGICFYNVSYFFLKEIVAMFRLLCLLEEQKQSDNFLYLNARAEIAWSMVMLNKCFLD